MDAITSPRPIVTQAGERELGGKWVLAERLCTGPRSAARRPMARRSLFGHTRTCRYDRENHFQEDLFSRSPGDRKNFPGRLPALRPPLGRNPRMTMHPGRSGKRSRKRSARGGEQTFAHLTGWNFGGIARKKGISRQGRMDTRRQYQVEESQMGGRKTLLLRNSRTVGGGRRARFTAPTWGPS